MRSNQSGFATVTITVLLLSVIILVTLYTARFKVQEQRIIRNHASMQEATMVADAGLEQVVIRLDSDKNDLDRTMTGNIGGANYSATTTSTRFSNTLRGVVDIVDIELTANSADLICSNLGVNNFKNRTIVYSRIQKILKPGCHFVFTTNDKHTFHELFGLFTLALKDLKMDALAFEDYVKSRGSKQTIIDEIGSERCINMGGKTTLRQLLVLYFLSEAMVTNDSGPAHYAALSPMDVVTIFGPETPAVFGSKSERAHLLWEGLPCSPCVNAFNDRWTPCQNNVCMQRITVDQVFARVCGIYERRRALRETPNEAS